MKKLLNKFTSIFLAVVLLMSFLLAVPVSAESTAEVLNEPLLKSLPEPPIKYLSNFFENDVLIYDKFVIFRYYYNNKTYYNTYCINSVSRNSSVISYFNLGSNTSPAYSDDLKQLQFNCVVLNYCQDTDTYTSSRYINTSYANALSLAINNYNVNGTDLAIETATKNIIYSDFLFKYGGLTVFDPAEDNKSFTIPGLFDSSGSSSTNPQPIAPTPGDYDFIGPLPLIPIEGDPSFQGFKDWLIKNKKYEDLAQFGISCTENNISSVVDLWTGNYNSVSGFFSSLKSAWSTISAVSQAKNIYNWLEQQWQLYKKSLITYETIPIKDKDVLNYETDYDEDGNFISSETAYLKLILGILNTFRNDVNNFSDTLSSYISSISVNINRLCNAVSALPQTIANLTYNNFVEPFNQILKAIDDISINNSSDNITNNNIDVNIDIDNIDNTTNNFNIAFGDLQVALESKFSFYNQLTEITNTVQNYTYTDTAPELILNLGSEIGLPDTDYKIDFSFYEPYREMIRKIIIAVAYISFAISLLNKLPNIIGGI